MKNHIAPKIILIMLVMFILQFFVAPTLFARYFPSSNEAGGIFLSTIIVFSLLEMLLVSDKIPHWILGDFMYFLLMMFFNRGAYGIGWVGVPLDGIVPQYDPTVVPIFVAAYAVLTLAVQFLLWTGIMLVRRFLNRR